MLPLVDAADDERVGQPTGEPDANTRSRDRGISRGGNRVIEDMVKVRQRRINDHLRDRLGGRAVK